eukprot:12986072-Ditylum_brightwellii.AAC.1
MLTRSFYWRETETIHGCTSSNDSTRVCKFNKSVCTKKKGLNIKSRATERAEDRNEMAPKLNPGDWVLFESPEPDQQLVWLERAIMKEE